MRTPKVVRLLLKPLPHAPMSLYTLNLERSPASAMHQGNDERGPPVGILLVRHWYVVVWPKERARPSVPTTNAYIGRCVMRKVSSVLESCLRGALDELRGAV